MTNKIKLLLTALCVVTINVLFAQGPPDYSAVCKAEMKKLAYLEGAWKGEATFSRGPGTEMTINQEEKIEFKLDRTLLSIEGIGRDPYGSVAFHALGLVNFDAPTKKFKFKSYMKDGRSTDAYFTIAGENKFEWGFDIPGGGKSRYSIILDPVKKTWHETGEYSQDGSTWMKFIEMNLRKVE